MRIPWAYKNCKCKFRSLITAFRCSSMLESITTLAHSCFKTFLHDHSMPTLVPTVFNNYFQFPLRMRCNGTVLLQNSTPQPSTPIFWVDLYYLYTDLNHELQFIYKSGLHYFMYEDMIWVSFESEKRGESSYSFKNSNFKIEKILLSSYEMRPINRHLNINTIIKSEIEVFVKLKNYHDREIYFTLEES